MAFWVRNISGGVYVVNDLRKLTFSVGAERDLYDGFYSQDIKQSSDLDTALAASDLTRIDGPGGTPIPYANAYDDVVVVHAIDGASHTGSLSASDVGLGNVTDDAQLKRSAADFDTFAEKAVISNDDIVLIEDSTGALAKKKVKVSNLPGGGGSGPGADMKGNHVLAASFAGNPKIASVAFTTAYADANYSVSLGCVTSVHVQFMPSIENKAAGGFDINMGCNNINGLVAVTWSVAPYGEA